MKITAQHIAQFLEEQTALERELETLLDGKNLALDNIVLVQALALAATIENQENNEQGREITSYARHLPALLFAQEIEVLRQTIVRLKAEEPVSFAGQALGDVPETWRDHLAATEHELATLKRENEYLRSQLGVEPTERLQHATVDLELNQENTEPLAKELACLQEQLDAAHATIENQKTELSLAQTHFEKLQQELKALRNVTKN